MLELTTRESAHPEFILRVHILRFGTTIRPSSRTTVEAVSSLCNLQTSVARVGTSVTSIGSTLHTEGSQSTSENKRRTSIETTTCSTIATSTAGTSASRSSTNSILRAVSSKVVTVCILHLSSVSATTTTHSRSIATATTRRSRTTTRNNFKLDSSYTLWYSPKVTTTTITGNIMAAVEEEVSANNTSGNTRYLTRTYCRV